jgi:repressor LexA
MKDLSTKQQAILNFLREYIDKHDYPPSIREIQDACSISSTSVVDYNLRALEKLGYIRRDREISRGIELVDGLRRVRAVPIIGTIAAGQPIPVPTDSYDPSDTVQVPPHKLENRQDVYALRVKGDSMIDDMVRDGDIVVIERAQTARDGETVAAWLKNEQEVTLKRFYREGDRVRLQPANSAMQPIYTDADNIEIQGKLVLIDHDFS